MSNHFTYTQTEHRTDEGFPVWRVFSEGDDIGYVWKVLGNRDVSEWVCGRSLEDVSESSHVARNDAAEQLIELRVTLE